jgi:alpha-glucosidase
MTQIRITTVLVFFLASFSARANTQLESPDGNIMVQVNWDEKISFSVDLNGETLISNAKIDLEFDGKTLLSTGNLQTTRNTVDETVKPEFSYRQSTLQNRYNLLTLHLGNGVKIAFRAYNSGVAYRFVISINRQVQVNEVAEVTFAEDVDLWSSLVSDFKTMYEENYSRHTVSEFPDSLKTYTPLLAGDEQGNKLLITDTDVFDYPHMFFGKSDAEHRLQAVFPPYPTEVELSGDRTSNIKKEAEYIAKTSGNRSFPWRLMIVAEKDGELIENNLVYLLSRQNKVKDTSWIEPGRVAWDWWGALNLHGVDFESGKNTETYKYYIDFAAKQGFEYVILDAGWSVSRMDISKANSNIDMPDLLDYADKHGIGLIVWTGWLTLYNNMDVMELYNEWGLAGIKIDFMNRSDQWMVNYYERVAEKAAENELLINFHGSFKPAGLRRAYPNVVNFEAVAGLERTKWSKEITSQHDVTIPFIRMVCGPMDYTPGAMRNFHPEKYTPLYDRPGSMTTRSHQVALYMIYESGIQMFSDSPSNYMEEQETTDFMSRIPVTWDEIKVLKAKIGDYLILARRNGDKWFVGGITDENERKFTLDFSFLDSQQYKATILRDGINADRFAEDYKMSERMLTDNDTYEITMEKNGGFAMILKPN